MRRIVILIGAPGVGKGTAARSCVKCFGLMWLSSGDLLRSVKKTGSEEGKRIASLIDRGRLVPDELIVRLVEAEISSVDKDACLMLDGFPRTLPQARSLDEVLEKNGDEVSLVVELTADRTEIQRRILERAKREGREDDTLSSLKRRLELFDNQTVPLVDYYRETGKLQHVNGMGTPDQVLGRISLCIQKALSILPVSSEKEAG